MARQASEEKVLDAFRGSSPSALIQISDGLVALNAVKELMADAIRAMTRSVEDGTESIARTNAAQDIGPALI